MSRFFVEKEYISDNEIVIVGEDVKHISKVLRLRTGEKISVCDKCRTDYLCEVSEISPDKVSARIIEKSENTAEPPVFLTLYQGLPKSDKMDYIIQKCVELGVSEIVPVITKRAVSIPRDGDKKITRWQRIAEEAAKQCGRGIVPRVSPVVDFDRAILEMTSRPALNIMPYECEKEAKLREPIGETSAKNINIIIRYFLLIILILRYIIYKLILLVIVKN